MDTSIWSGPLEAFYQDLAAAKPAPAAVTAAAVTARLGMALLIKSLEVMGRRKSFSGDRELLLALLAAARQESQRLADVADEDIAADAHRRQNEVPSKAARAAEAGWALCGESRALVSGAVKADLEAAVLLLESAVRAIHICLHANAGGGRQKRP